MNKQIGIFEIKISAPYPYWCDIITDRGNIRFSHENLPDLEHAVNEIKRSVIAQLPQNDKI